ncbi:MAG: prepilin-type N-terminal cleavage/methylation domain-containing protein [Acidobacteria bacterium]|nr:prepilin-type N-terminal cleavage/methylation domain-containing protein [Acidobacteriota bacterium]
MAGTVLEGARSGRQAAGPMGVEAEIAGAAARAGSMILHRETGLSVTFDKSAKVGELLRYATAWPGRGRAWRLESLRSVVPERQRGFTLFEIIIVVVIIAVAAAVVAPSMRRGLAGMRLETKGRDLATLCRAARTLAVGEQSVYRLGIEQDKHSIFLADAYRNKIRDFDLTDEIRLEAVRYEGGENQEAVLYVNFYPNGRADEVELTLKNEQDRRVILKTDVLTGTARLVVSRERP